MIFIIGGGGSCSLRVFRIAFSNVPSIHETFVFRELCVNFWGLESLIGSGSKPSLLDVKYI